MPTYEYKCESCGEEFDYFQKFSDTPLTKCEKCGGKLIKLVSGGTGLIFKGTGFYITDYKKSSEGSKKTAKTPAGGVSDNKTTAKADAAPKSEAKSDAKPTTPSKESK